MWPDLTCLSARGRSAVRSATLLFLLAFAGLASPRLVSIEGYEILLILLQSLVCAAGVVICLLRQPPMGLVALVLCSLLVGFEFETGTRTGLNAAFLLAPVIILIWLVTLISQRRERRPVSSRPILPLGLFLFVATLSFILGQFPLFPISGAPLAAQAVGLAVFLFSGGVFLVAADQLRDLRWLQRITWLFLGLSAVVVPVDPPLRV